MIRGQSKWGKLIIIPKSFAGKVSENPISFLENLIVDVEMNGWDETNLLEVIERFLKDDIREWFIDNWHRFQHWDETTNPRHSFVLKFVVRFKTKAQVKVWHHKWNALECEDDEDVSGYTTCFKRVYKRVDLHKSTPSRTIIWKSINSLFLKFVKLLTIIGPANLNKAIEATLNIKAS